ncbi:MAG: alpha/beta fold hydrolase [Dehalococcoidia bacterium]|nr:alpha/beta fold hydrolase [Dehalococcoidia bacterium]
MSSPVRAENFHLKADGLRLAAQLYRPEAPPPWPAVCMCHGVPAGRTPDPSDRGYPALAEKYAAGGFAVLIFNFRGAGESEGNFDMLGWTRDLKAAVDYLHTRDDVDRTRLSLMGFSGGAVATVYCAANDRRIAAVVSCACPARFFDIEDFSRIEEFLEHCRRIGIIRDPGFPPSVEKWASDFDRLNALQWIDRIAPRPILIVHGDRDETVPPRHAWMLYEKAGEPKEIAIIDGAGHRLRTNEPAMNTALAWLKRVAGPSGKE